MFNLKYFISSHVRLNIYTLEDQEKLIEYGIIDEYGSAFMEGYLAAET